ncbi:MAG TPA: hypothetical protein VNH46_10685, partial [Gemmatimonadales bacterium]|nr:hypothetical protein [Gemmatimonadales bacterium]
MAPTFREVAGILGAAIGRPDLGYAQFPPPEVRQALIGAGFSPAAADGLLAMMAGFNSRAVAARQPRSPATTTPTTLEEFARDRFAPAFRH